MLSEGCMPVSQRKGRNFLWSTDYRYKFSFPGKNKLRCGYLQFQISVSSQEHKPSRMECWLPTASPRLLSFPTVLPPSHLVTLSALSKELCLLFRDHLVGNSSFPRLCNKQLPTQLTFGKHANQLGTAGVPGTPVSIVNI